MVNVSHVFTIWQEKQFKCLKYMGSLFCRYNKSICFFATSHMYGVKQIKRLLITSPCSVFYICVISQHLNLNPRICTTCLIFISVTLRILWITIWATPWSHWEVFVFQISLRDGKWVKNFKARIQWQYAMINGKPSLSNLVDNILSKNIMSSL